MCLIGREKDLAIFMDELHRIKTSTDPKTQLQVIVLEGDAGIGKTRVMREVMDKAEEEGIR